MAGPFTKTEQRILQRLSDGMPHFADELAELLWDEQSEDKRAAVQVHICRIRPKLPRGEHIACEMMNRKGAYRHVRLLASAYDGRY